MLFHQLKSRNSERSFRVSGNVIQEEEDVEAVITRKNSNCDANASSVSNEVDLNQQAYISQTNSETVIELTAYTTDVKTATATHCASASACDSGSTNTRIEECNAITFV